MGIPLPAGGYATPSVYLIDGKQYVVIAAGGGGKNGANPSGFIGLQMHGVEGKGPFVMKWRNIRIRPL
jgi:hypothetical protein